MTATNPLAQTGKQIAKLIVEKSALQEIVSNQRTLIEYWRGKAAESGRLRPVLNSLFQACSNLPVEEMDRMEAEINAASEALKEGK